MMKLLHIPRQNGKYSDLSEIKILQEKLLNEHIAYCRKNSPYYASLNLPKKKISLEQLCDIPATDKKTFAERNPDFIAVPQTHISDISLTSGTTGSPCLMAYTQHDLERLTLNDAIGFADAGVSAQDTVLLTCTMDRCFIAGLAYYSACRKLGAAAIRNGLNSIHSHAQLIRDFRPTTIVGVPSFLAKLGEFMSHENMQRDSVRRLICIGEPLRTASGELTAVAQRLDDIWPDSLYSTYASSEIFTSFTECRAQCGGHAPYELAILEILDDDGNVLPPGETGEVTVTPLQVEGTPLLRFRTGDISFIHPEPCPCGNPVPRLGPILGRKAQMLKIQGTTLFPQTIYNVLDAIPEIKEYYITVTGTGLSDHVCVTFADNGVLNTEEFTAWLHAKTRLKLPVVRDTLENVRAKVFGGGRKATRFFDNRIQDGIK